MVNVLRSSIPSAEINEYVRQVSLVPSGRLKHRNLREKVQQARMLVIEWFYLKSASQANILSFSEHIPIDPFP